MTPLFKKVYRDQLKSETKRTWKDKARVLERMNAKRGEVLAFDVTALYEPIQSIKYGPNHDEWIKYQAKAIALAPGMWLEDRETASAYYVEIPPKVEYGDCGLFNGEADDVFVAGISEVGSIVLFEGTNIEKLKRGYGTKFPRNNKVKLFLDRLENDDKYMDYTGFVSQAMAYAAALRTQNVVIETDNSARRFPRKSKRNKNPNKWMDGIHRIVKFCIDGKVIYTNKTKYSTGRMPLQFVCGYERRVRVGSPELIQVEGYWRGDKANGITTREYECYTQNTTQPTNGVSI